MASRWSKQPAVIEEINRLKKELYEDALLDPQDIVQGRPPKPSAREAHALWLVQTRGYPRAGAVGAVRPGLSTLAGVILCKNGCI